MKNLKINNSILRIAFSLFIAFNLISCEDEESTTFDNILNIDQNIGLTYNVLSTYSLKELILSENPQFNIDGSLYSFSIKEVRLDNQKLETGLSKFTIDKKTGVISIDNNEGILIPGKQYDFDIAVGNVDGVILTENAFSLTVLDIPLSYSITNESFESNFLENVVVATVSYVDTSENNDVLSNVSYSLVNPDSGFSIEPTTGVISKTTQATTGEHTISIAINTNVGSSTFENVLTVTVGEAPTVNYLKKDGITDLNKVVLSPWTAYSTTIPVIDGMNAVSYEIILPETLVSGSVIANADGSISVLTDQNLPLGDHSLGVIATNSSGISATFNDVFTLSVETRWETTPIFYEDFNNAIDPPEELNAYNASLNSYLLNGASMFGFQAAYTASKGVYTAKLSEGKVDGGFATAVDAAMVLELTMQPEWRKMRVAFSEGFGFGDNRLDWYERSLQSSHNNADVVAGNYDSNNWNTVMPIGDNSWSGTSIWKTLSSDADLNQIPFKNVEITPGNTSVFLNWRVQKTGTATGGAAFLIDNIKVEVSNAFEAEEI